MAVEWTIRIEGRNEFGDVCRKAVRVDKSWERPFDGDLGLSIEDSKMIMTVLRSAVVNHEAETYSLFRRVCPDCHRFRAGKNYTKRQIRTVFGTVEVRNPRWMICRECYSRRSTRCWQAKLPPLQKGFEDVALVHLGVAAQCDHFRLPEVAGETPRVHIVLHQVGEERLCLPIPSAPATASKRTLPEDLKQRVPDFRPGARTFGDRPVEGSQMTAIQVSNEIAGAEPGRAPDLLHEFRIPELFGPSRDNRLDDCNEADRIADTHPVEEIRCHRSGDVRRHSTFALAHTLRWPSVGQENGHLPSLQERWRYDRNRSFDAPPLAAGPRGGSPIPCCHL